MISFQEMNLPDVLLHALENMNFTTPTPIQQQAIPLALAGQDILGSAHTGTGKTGAFGIPLIVRLLTNPNSSALVMTPTRELATQVISQLHAMLGRKSTIKSALLIGGEPMPKQLQQLRQKPRILVGTPGRVNDHLKRGNIKLRNADFLVLDETDRMLDMDFSIQIEDIIASMSPNRQTLLFSATVPQNIVRISEKYLKNPAYISVDSPSSPLTKITQKVVHTTTSNKYSNLLSEISERNGSMIVFVNTKMGTERMAKKLSTEGYETCSIHGDLRQHKRDRVIAAFRQEKYRILVATDVAARGLDIPHIAHVINYDLPQCAEDYIHRIGRTGRAGAEGAALSFLSPSDKHKWRAIERLLDPSLPAGKPNRPKSPRNHSNRFSENTYGAPRSNSPRSHDRSEDTRSSSYGDRHQTSKEFSRKNYDNAPIHKKKGVVKTSRMFNMDNENTQQEDTTSPRNHTDRNFADKRPARTDNQSEFSRFNGEKRSANYNGASDSRRDNRSDNRSNRTNHANNSGQTERNTDKSFVESNRNSRVTHVARTDHAGRTDRHAPTDVFTDKRPSRTGGQARVDRFGDRRPANAQGTGENHRDNRSTRSNNTEYAGQNTDRNFTESRGNNSTNAERSHRHTNASSQSFNHTATARKRTNNDAKNDIENDKKFSYADTGFLKRKTVTQ